MDANQQELTFEEAFAQLQEVVQRLETGKLSLTETLQLYEEGIRLAKLCSTHLDAAELRVRQLTPTPTGDYVEEDFDDWNGDEA